MIDSIKISKRITIREKSELLKKSDPSKILRNGDGEIKQSGMDKILITWKEEYLNIGISLPKLKYGHNLYSLKYSSIVEIIDALEFLLGINLSDAHLGRIDIGLEISHKQPPFDLIKSPPVDLGK